MPEASDGGAQVLEYVLTMDVADSSSWWSRLTGGSSTGGTTTAVRSSGSSSGEGSSLLQPAAASGGGYRRERRADGFRGFGLGYGATGLPADTDFCVELEVFNNQGGSDVSARVCDRTAVAPPPLAPPALWVRNTSSVGVLVGWSAANGNGAPILGYMLQMDDWWSEMGEGNFYTVGDLPGTDFEAIVTSIESLRPGDALLPAMPLRLRVAAVSEAGIGEWSDVVESSTDIGVFCGDGADMTTFRARISTLQSEIQSCLIRCIIGGPECAAECIVADTGLSLPCAGCWANMGLCTLERCALPCLFPTSAACATCSETNCFPAAVECTSIPMWAFPR